MLEESKLPTYFWDETINTASYTQNISIINQAHGKTPYQLMKNKKPTINFLHVLDASVLYSETTVKILGSLKQRQMNQYLLDMQPQEPIESTIL